MEKLIEKIKEHLENLNNKKFINNLFIILIVSVIALLMISIFDNDDKDKPELATDSNIEQRVVYDDYNSYLENKLEDILEKLEGVGEVEVMITFEDSKETIPASNTTKTTEVTKEIDSDGGTREVNREDVNIQMVSSSDKGNLVVLKEINPSIKGAIVVAEGAENLEVMERLYEAVKTVLGVTGNKVQVYSSK